MEICINIFYNITLEQNLATYLNPNLKKNNSSVL